MTLNYFILLLTRFFILILIIFFNINFPPSISYCFLRPIKMRIGTGKNLVFTKTSHKKWKMRTFKGRARI